jgi:hypothetical protein
VTARGQRANPPSATQRDVAESENVAGFVSPCWSEEERHARSQGDQPRPPLLVVRHALGLRTPLTGLCCQPARRSLSREVGLTLSAQHAVVLVHAHTTAAGRTPSVSGTTVTQRV